MSVNQRKKRNLGGHKNWYSFIIILFERCFQLHVVIIICKDHHSVVSIACKWERHPSKTEEIQDVFTVIKHTDPSLGQPKLLRTPIYPKSSSRAPKSKARVHTQTGQSSAIQQQMVIKYLPSQRVEILTPYLSCFVEFFIPRHLYNCIRAHRRSSAPEELGGCVLKITHKVDDAGIHYRLDGRVHELTCGLQSV